MARTVADDLLDVLVAAGVTHIYGLVGDSLNAFSDAVRRSGGAADGGVDWVHVHNEEAAAFAASAAPPPSPGAGAPGNANGELGLVGMDHVGITVPDIGQAVDWFEDVMGCVAPLSFGPFFDDTGTFMQDLLDVGAYAAGSNPKVDAAVASAFDIDAFLQQDMDDVTPNDEAWQRLARLVGTMGL